MKLSDIVGHAGLAFYTEVALVVFLLVFVAVVLRTWRPSRSAELEAQRQLPLAPDVPAPPGEETPRQAATALPGREAHATSSKGAER